MKLNLRLVLLSALLCMTSCSSIFPTATAKRIFILANTANSECQAKDSFESNLKIIEGSSSSQQHANKIWFQKGAELGFYQFAEWSEPVTDRFSRLLEQSIRCKQNYSFQNGDILEFSILNFVHSAEQQPGELVLNIRLSLLRAGNILSEKAFSYSEPLNSYDVLGVVEASNLLVDKFLKDLAGFLTENSQK